MAQAPKQFKVIYRDSDRMIIGLDPKGGGVGSGNKLEVMRDWAEYPNLMKYDPAYLTTDLKIVGAPPA